MIITDDGLLSALMTKEQEHVCGRRANYFYRLFFENDSREIMIVGC